MQAPFYAGLGDHFVGGEWRVDTTHNELMAMTNVGTRPTDALLTLYYDKGKEKYEMQQKIEPGDQMWLNFADLIHRRVADRKGRVLPADLASGTYDLRDLNPGKGGNLIGSELALDTTLGQQAGPDILRCCGYENPGPFPSIEEILFLQSSPLDVQALDCNGNEVQISNYFGDWWSGNTSVAQVTYRNVYGAGPGSTYGDASGEVPIGNAGYCTVKLEQVQVPITVWQLSLLCDPHLVIGNNMVAPSSTGTCTASITPQGINLPGVYSWSVSNQNLTVPNSNQASVTETAKSASGSPDDTVVTVKYTPNDGSGAKSVTAAVTVHKPTSLAVDSDTTTPNGIAYNVPCLDPNHKSTCGATSQQCSDPSYLRVRTYDVQDQFTPPNKLSYFGLNDSVNTETFPITTTCPNQQFDSGIPTRGTIFKDQFFLCSTCCLAGGPGCTLDSNPKQVIYVDGWDVREVQAHYDCSSATLNP